MHWLIEKPTIQPTNQPTNQPTSWSWALLEKPPVVQLLKNFST
jgi:hypothetical protein